MKLKFMSVIAFCLLMMNSALARDYIDVVGSSTVYPFSTVVAEVYGKKTGNKTPKIESTGSGGGFKLFCSAAGVDTPDITNSSRRIKKSEFDDCQQNGVKEIVEIKVGYDGIAIANSNDGPVFSISLKQLFLALAKQVPNPKQSGKLITNPYQKWSDIDASLPNQRIEVLGPPPTSGTRDAFVELALEGGCQKFDWIKALSKTDKSLYKSICHTVREDGIYVEAGENDNLIVEKLSANPNALGIFGFSFLDQNFDKVHGSMVDGVAISFENIADGSYPISRPLYFYVKKSHVDKVPGIREFLNEFTSDEAWGEEGYLTDKGLIPLSGDEAKLMKSNADNLTALQL